MLVLTVPSVTLLTTPAAVSAAPVPAIGEEGPPPIVVPDAPDPVAKTFHGFRLGYSYVNELPANSPLSSPHMFVVGYEFTQRAVGGDWLNVITVENVSVAGINQSVFVPSFNGLVGFELAEQVQLGTGINITPFDPAQKYVHQVIAVGWTPAVGAFNMPIHATFIPDVDGQWRAGTTVGVNW